MCKDTNYDTLFIVISLYDAYPGTKFYKQNIANIIANIIKIIDTNNFKCVSIFDNYDYDYDPNMVVSHPKINKIFNYKQKK